MFLASWLLFRLESSFRSFSRPVLHAAARVVQEMGKSRAAAFALGILDIDEREHVNDDSDSLENPYAESNSSIFCLLPQSCIFFHIVFKRISFVLSFDEHIQRNTKLI